MIRTVGSELLLAVVFAGSSAATSLAAYAYQNLATFVAFVIVFAADFEA